MGDGLSLRRSRLARRCGFGFSTSPLGASTSSGARAWFGWPGFLVDAKKSERDVMPKSPLKTMNLVVNSAVTHCGAVRTE
jgi:hypothetical protein